MTVALFWSEVAPLSGQFIADDHRALAFPDFSEGRWKDQKLIFAVDDGYWVDFRRRTKAAARRSASFPSGSPRRARTSRAGVLPVKRNRSWVACAWSLKPWRAAAPAMAARSASGVRSNACRRRSRAYFLGVMPTAASNGMASHLV